MTTLLNFLAILKLYIHRHEGYQSYSHLCICLHTSTPVHTHQRDILIVRVGEIQANGDQFQATSPQHTLT